MEAECAAASTGDCADHGNGEDEAGETLDEFKHIHRYSNVVADRLSQSLVLLLGL